MKAYKIDAYENKIETIDIPSDADSGSLDAMYKAINCSCFCVGKALTNRDTLYVDDEGYLNLHVTRGFLFDGQFLAGNGLLLGSNEVGESTPVKSNIEDIQKRVKFMIPAFTITDEMRDAAMGSWQVIPLK